MNVKKRVYNHIAKALSRERIKAALTQTDLANACGRSAQFISQTESGKCALPALMSWKIAERINPKDPKAIFDILLCAGAKDWKDRYVDQVVHLMDGDK